MIYVHYYHSPLGNITMAANGQALTGLWFDGQKYFGDTLPEEYDERPLPVFEKAREWLDIYFQGRAPEFTPPLYLEGTSFRKEIWDILLTIPYGQTRTYGELACRIAYQSGVDRMSAQAVGGAVSHNPISLIIPCHRVIGAKGSLIGYAGGIGIKGRLLELERKK